MAKWPLAGLVALTSCLCLAGSSLAYTNCSLFNVGLLASGLYAYEHEVVISPAKNVTLDVQFAVARPAEPASFMVSFGSRKYYDGEPFNSVYLGLAGMVFTSGSSLIGVGPDAGFRWTSSDGYSIDIGMSYKICYDTASSVVRVSGKPGLRLSIGKAW